MTSGSTMPVTHLEEREELAAVLRAPEFARAPRLAQLLEYLCEKLFAGATGQIKEYSIGVELFGRSPAFDQESDSIVRVEANRLRKRLAEYYAGEGAGHALRIAIPVGQYVPEFQRSRRAAPDPDPALLSGIPTSPAPSAGRRRQLILWISLAGGACAILLVAAFVAFWARGRQPHVTAEPITGERSSGFPPDFAVGVPSGDEVRILCGATHSLVDHAGKLWTADERFTGGAAIKSSVQHIWRTQEPAFYRTSRQGDFRYDLPLRPGVYELRLHFAETVYGPESTGTGGEGSRLMTVRVNGKAVLSAFDVVADAGASRTADVKVFPDISPGNDGQLHLEFAGQDGAQATLSAVEIVPGRRGKMRPVRILTRQSPYYSNDSLWWSPDSYFEGGQFATYTTPVTGTDDQELYDSERWGNFSYAIPVAPGRYTLSLHFAVRHGEWPTSSSGGPGAAHIFDVYCNGKALLENFDLPREAGNKDILVHRATGLEPNAQGKLMLTFVPVQGYATVTGIEVVPQ